MTHRHILHRILLPVITTSPLTPTFSIETRFFSTVFLPSSLSVSLFRGRVDVDATGEVTSGNAPWVGDIRGVIAGEG